MSLAPTTHGLPNDTPVMWRANMLHYYEYGETACRLKGGVKITLVQALVYLNKLPWCFACWGSNHPHIK